MDNILYEHIDITNSSLVQLKCRTKTILIPSTILNGLINYTKKEIKYDGSYYLDCNPKYINYIIDFLRGISPPWELLDNMTKYYLIEEFNQLGFPVDLPKVRLIGINTNRFYITNLSTRNKNKLSFTRSNFNLQLEIENEGYVGMNIFFKKNLGNVNVTITLLNNIDGSFDISKKYEYGDKDGKELVVSRFARYIDILSTRGYILYDMIIFDIQLLSSSTLTPVSPPSL